MGEAGDPWCSSVRGWWRARAVCPLCAGAETQAQRWGFATPQFCHLGLVIHLPRASVSSFYKCGT